MSAVPVSLPSAHSAAALAFARTVVPITANRITSDLLHNTGRHVALVCIVITIVRADSMVGNCGTAAEPVDFYVALPTTKLRVGERLRVLGEMQPPPFWVDATSHTWYTALMKADFVDPM